MTSQKYSLLQERESSDCDTEMLSQSPKQHLFKYCAEKRRFYAVFALILGLVVSIFLNLALLMRQQHCYGRRPSELYSPAQDATEYQVVRFDSSIYTGKTAYQGYPSEASEKLWDDLYPNLLSRISAEDARLLPNKTVAQIDEVDESAGYVIALNVFHDLHCLHSVRKAIYYFHQPEWNATLNPYTEHGSAEDGLVKISHQLRLEHLDHCIDVLRQSVQCTSDITPNVYQLNPRQGEITARSAVAHECRNFDKIQQWAKDHAVIKPVLFEQGGEELGICGEDHPETCI